MCSWVAAIVNVSPSRTAATLSPTRFGTTSSTCSALPTNSSPKGPPTRPAKLAKARPVSGNGSRGIVTDTYPSPPPGKQHTVLTGDGRS